MHFLSMGLPETQWCELVFSINSASEYPLVFAGFVWSLLKDVWKVVSARLFLWGCAASFLWKLPFHHHRPAAAGQLLLLLLSRLMLLLRPAAAASTAQLLLTHWCQLKQLEQSEAKTQKSHSLELTKLSLIAVRFLQISDSRSNSQSTIATCWQIFRCTRQLWNPRHVHQKKKKLKWPCKKSSSESCSNPSYSKNVTQMLTHLRLS